MKACDAACVKKKPVKEKKMAWIIAILSGAAMSIQGVWNTGVTKQTSVWVANTFVQFSAFVVCLLVWVCKDRESFAKLMQVTPRYMLLGGAIGVFITYSVIVSMNQLGPAKAVMLIVISQLLVAYLLELFGWFGVEKSAFEIRKLVGMGLAIAGFIIFKWT